MMNTMNASTGYSAFQLKMGRTPRVIPPLIPNDLPADLHHTDDTATALAVIERVLTDMVDQWTW